MLFLEALWGCDVLFVFEVLFWKVDYWIWLKAGLVLLWFLFWYVQCASVG